MNLLLKPVRVLPLRTIRAPFCSFPGGYYITYYDLHAGDAVCARCATFERFKTKLTPDVHWEGASEICAVCNTEMPSEYGDPDQDDQDEEFFVAYDEDTQP